MQSSIFSGEFGDRLRSKSLSWRSLKSILAIAKSEQIHNLLVLHFDVRKVGLN